VTRDVFEDAMPLTYDKTVALETVYFGVPKNQTMHVDNDGIVSNFLIAIKLSNKNFRKKYSIRR
jgi:hypothetical protein